MHRRSRSGRSIGRAVSCALEHLENRTLLSTIVWDNRGTTDNFGIYPNAALARSIVDRAIDDWEKVIVNFNYSGGGNTYHVDVFAGPIGGRGATDNAVYNAQGKPTSADVFMDDNGEGGGWFFDPDPGSANVPDDSEYTTWITPFAGDGAGVGNDFYRTIVHELGHAMGILVGTAGVASGVPAINSFMSDSGFNDANSGANLMAFNVGGGAVEATLTTTGGGHFYEGPAVGGLPIHPNDLLNAGRTVDTGLNRRQLISDLDATVLDLAYGYTITLPSQINSMHANLNTVTNTLNVIGNPGAAADNITLSLSGGNLRVQVNGTSEIIPVAEITSVVVNAGAGNDTISIDGLTAGLTVTVNAGDGTDTINVGGGDIDSNLDSNLTVNAGTGTDTIRFEDTLDGATGDTYLITTALLNKGGRVVNFTGAEALDVFGSAQPSDYTVQSVAATVTLEIIAGAAADTFVIGNGDFDANILGDVRITGGSGIDDVLVNDSADAGNDAHQLSGNRYEKLGAPGTLTLLNTTELFTVNGSGADNDWYVTQMSPWLDVTFIGGAGDDTFDVARGTADLDNNILGILTMNGGAGTDALFFRDTADGAGSDSYTLTASTLAKPALANPITFTSMSSIQLDASQNPDAINVTGIGGALTVRGNNGDDVIDVDTDLIVIGTSCVVDTGAGNDELRVNVDGVGATSVRIASSQTLATLNVAAGGVLTVDAGADKVLRINNLVSLGGRINLNDNFLIREAGAGVPNLGSYTNWLTNGYNGGDWLGAQPAITSSPADATSFALGYARASAIFNGGGGTFGGQLVSADAICVRFTRYGDANLDGTVNLQDFNRLAGSFGQTNTVWSQGNFNYDNITNLADFNKLAANFGLSASPDALAGGPTLSQRELRKLLDEATGGAIDVTGRRWSRRLVSATDVEEVTTAALGRTA